MQTLDETYRDQERKIKLLGVGEGAGCHSPGVLDRITCPGVRSLQNKLWRRQSLTCAELEGQRFLIERVHPGRGSGAMIKRRIAGANPSVWQLPEEIPNFLFRREMQKRCQ